jgi:hypothetical protein
MAAGCSRVAEPESLDHTRKIVKPDITVT